MTTEQKLNERVEFFLQKKAEKALIEKELEEIKVQIDELSDSSINRFVDGEYWLDAGKIKIAKNPHKCFYSETNEALEPKDRQELAELIDSRYHKIDVDPKSIYKSLATDKILKKQLEAKGIVITQVTRFDVKAL